MNVLYIVRKQMQKEARLKEAQYILAKKPV